MLQFLSQLWRLPLDLEEIEEQAIELEATLHEQIDTNPELADYIRRLEQVYDQTDGPQPDMNTDAIVDEIQQFLRRRRDNPLGNDLWLISGSPPLPPRRGRGPGSVFLPSVHKP